MRARVLTVIALVVASGFAAIRIAGDAPIVSAAGVFEPLPAPARVLDTRPGELTADGQAQGVGLRPAGSTFELPIGGRVAVPTDAAAVVLNVTVTAPQAAGYATVFPCGATVPTALEPQLCASADDSEPRGRQSVVDRLGVPVHAVPCALHRGRQRVLPDRRHRATRLTRPPAGHPAW